VRALFDDATLIEDDDFVSFEDGVEAMGDGDDRPSLHESARGFFEQRFGLGVEAGGWLIKDEDGGVFQEGTSEGETLCLSAAETRSAFADDGFVFVGKCFDEFMQMCGFGGFDNFFVSCIGFAEADVCGEGVVEEVWALRDPGDGRSGWWEVESGK